MMFTTKTEYGLKAMVRLAKIKDGKPISLAQIAKADHISQSYLEQIFSKLKANDLVSSVKGSDGGYILSRPASQINVFEIVEALEGPLAVFYCMAGESEKIGCSVKGCLTRKVWDELQKNIIKTLRKFKLSNLI